MEKEKIIVNADEALKITIENRMSFEACMEMIVAQCKSGFSSAGFFNEISEEAKDKLMDMGYLFGKEKDPMGLTITIISWKR